MNRESFINSELFTKANLINAEKDLERRSRRKKRLSIQNEAYNLLTEQEPPFGETNNVPLTGGIRKLCTDDGYIRSPFCECDSHKTKTKLRKEFLEKVRDFDETKTDDFLQFFESEIKPKKTQSFCTLTYVYDHWEDKGSFIRIFKSMASAALKYNHLIFELASMETKSSITMTKKQIWSLLCSSFFGFFSKSLNFFHLMSSSTSATKCKLTMILMYFSKMAKKEFCGHSVTYIRYEQEKTVLNEDMLICAVEVVEKMRVEDNNHMLWVNFANSVIGGGSLTNGSAQEELLFAKCPELFVLYILNYQQMNLNALETIKVVGLEIFSEYKGFGKNAKPLASSFKAKGLTVDSRGRVFQELVFMDALHWSDKNSPAECSKENIKREIGKANTAFFNTFGAVKPVSTGFWGCGVFKGNKQLKALIQIIAASNNKRNLVFNVIDDIEFKFQLEILLRLLEKKKCTIGELIQAILEFGGSEEDKKDVFDYLILYIGV